jgi:hypothetical protein
MNSVVEIRSYKLWPGMRTRLHRLMLEQAIPMLKRWKIDVEGHGPSMHDENSYFLMRRFDNLAHLQQSEDAFYGSDEWRSGPREAILACIENYTSIVLELDDGTIHALHQQPAARDATR